ncbi:VOC family protein [Ewingella sp. S1.OA.A_B6]
MIPRESVLRIARPTDNLQRIAQMYRDGLGFELLGEFNDHLGFYGVLIGHTQHHYHLEFTHHLETKVGRAPTQDNLLVFYMPDVQGWQKQCEQMQTAGFMEVASYNPYWDHTGKTFEDIDGYRVVLAQRGWTL